MRFGKYEPKKSLSDLALALWKLDPPRHGVAEDIYFMATDEARLHMGRYLRELELMVARFGKGIRSFKCNPDHAHLKKRSGIRLKTFDELRITVTPQAVAGGKVHMERHTCIVTIPPTDLSRFIEEVERQGTIGGYRLIDSDPPLCSAPIGDWEITE